MYFTRAIPFLGLSLLPNPTETLAMQASDVEAAFTCTPALYSNFLTNIPDLFLWDFPLEGSKYLTGSDPVRE